MGGSLSSPSEWNENALNETIQDTLLLAAQDEDLRKHVINHYLTALVGGVIHLDCDFLLSKQQHRHTKIADLEAALASSNNKQVFESLQWKLEKYYSRELASLVPRNSFAELLECRHDLMSRLFLAYVRAKKRSEIQGEGAESSAEDKEAFLRDLLSADDEQMANSDKEVVDRIVKLSHCLPPLFGLTGLTGQVKAAEQPVDAQPPQDENEPPQQPQENADDAVDSNPANRANVRARLMEQLGQLRGSMRRGRESAEEPNSQEEQQDGSLFSRINSLREIQEVLRRAAAAFSPSGSSSQPQPPPAAPALPQRNPPPPQESEETQEVVSPPIPQDSNVPEDDSVPQVQENEEAPLPEEQEQDQEQELSLDQSAEDLSRALAMSLVEAEFQAEEQQQVEEQVEDREERKEQEQDVHQEQQDQQEQDASPLLEDEDALLARAIQMSMQQEQANEVLLHNPEEQGNEPSRFLYHIVDPRSDDESEVQPQMEEEPAAPVQQLSEPELELEPESESHVESADLQQVAPPVPLPDDDLTSDSEVSDEDEDEEEDEDEDEDQDEDDQSGVMQELEARARDRGMTLEQFMAQQSHLEELTRQLLEAEQNEEEEQEEDDEEEEQDYEDEPESENDDNEEDAAEEQLQRQPARWFARRGRARRPAQRVFMTGNLGDMDLPGIPPEIMEQLRNRQRMEARGGAGARDRRRMAPMVVDASQEEDTQEFVMSELLFLLLEEVAGRTLRSMRTTPETVVEPQTDDVTTREAEEEEEEETGQKNKSEEEVRTEEKESSDKDAPTETAPKPELADSLLRLLAMVQRHLFKVSASKRRTSSEDADLLRKYCLRLLELACEMMDCWMEDPSVHRTTVLQKGFMGRVVSSALLVIYSLVFSGAHNRLGMSIFHVLSKLVKKLRHIYLYPEAVAAVVDTKEEPILSPVNQVVVESPHAYYTNTNSVQQVCIPGASVLVVNFDRRCHTDHQRDFLSITLADNTPVCNDLHGPPQMWSKNPVVAQTDTLVFRFKSGSFDNKKWGYRCVVTGLRLSPPPNCLLVDLLRSATHLFGRCIRLMISGVPVSTQEEKHKKWLQASLFSGGMGSEEFEQEEHSHSLFEQDAAFLRALRTGSHPAIVQLNKHMKTQLPFMGTDHLGGAVMEGTVAAFVAVMLKHLALVAPARRLAHACHAEDDEQLKPPAAEDEDALHTRLLPVWSMGQKLRQWIVSRRQKRLMEHEEKRQRIEEKEESEQKEDLDALAAEEASLTYDAVCSPILERVLFMLKFRPGFEPPAEFPSEMPPALPLSRALSKPLLARSLSQMSAVSLSRQNSGTGGGTRGGAIGGEEHASWKALFSTYRALHSLTVKRGVVRTPTPVCLPNLLLTFVQSSTPAKAWRSMVQRHVDRSRTRSTAVAALRDMISPATQQENDLVFDMFLWDVLSSVGHPFRRYTSYEFAPAGGHFLRDLHCISDAQRREVAQSFVQLFQRISSLVLDERYPLHVRALLMNLWMVDASPADMPLLEESGMLDTLHAIVEKSITEKAGDASFGRLSSVAYKWLCLLNAGLGKPEHTQLLFSSQAPTSVVSLRARVLDTLLRDCTSSLDRLPVLIKTANAARVTSLQRASSGLIFEDKDASEHGSELMRTKEELLAEERKCFESFALLHTATVPACNGTEDRVRLEKVFQLCKMILRLGSPRLQRMALLVLRAVLPVLRDTEECSAESLVESMMNTVGTLLLVTEGMNQEEEEQGWRLDGWDCRNGEVVRNLALDYVMLLRWLAADDTLGWRAVVSAMVQSSLEGVTGVLDTERHCLKDGVSLSSSVLKKLFAVLAFLGAVPRFRVGAVVENHSQSAESASRESGLLCKMDRSSGRATVLWDENRKKALDCELAKLQPLAEVLPMSDVVSFTPELVRVLMLLTKKTAFDPNRTAVLEKDISEEYTLHVQELRKREKEAEQEEEESSPSQDSGLPQEWACGVCTFINIPHRIACEMCGTPNPTQPTAPVARDSPKKRAPRHREVDAGPMRQVPEPELGALLYHQLREQTISCLCTMIAMHSQEDTSSLLFAPSSLSPRSSSSSPSLLALLLDMAVRPTNLEEYKSVSQLEARKERLLELLYNKHACLEKFDDISSTRKRLTQADLLPESPFCKLSVSIPSRLDTGSAQATRFAKNENITRSCLHVPAVFTTHGIVRSDHLIPTSVPAYYFEVTVVEHGLDPEAPAKGEKNWDFAVGLFRDGLPLEGIPGAHSSYAYSAAAGQLHFTHSGLPMNRDFHVQWERGDTMGCGWDMRKGVVFFTKNGDRIAEDAFDNVSGRFYPCVWTQRPGGQLKINLGHEAFLYPFRATLPAHYLSQLEDAERGVHLSDVEMKRRTMAEDLVSMMGGSFPLEICIVALEHCGDDMMMAANWVFENGQRELERMAEAAIRNSERMANEAFGVGASEEKEEEEEDPSDLSTWLRHDVGNPQQQMRQASAAASFLDDEVEQEIPVGLDIEQPAATANSGNQAPGAAQQQHQQLSRLELVTSLAMPDVYPGMALTVSSVAPSICADQWHPSLGRYAGRTGCVLHTNVNEITVTVRFFHPELALITEASFPLLALHRPSRLWQDPYTELREQHPADASTESGAEHHAPPRGLGTHLMETCNALCTVRVREFILECVANWPDNVSFSVEQLGGVGMFVDLLMLAGAEYLVTGSSKTRFLENTNISHSRILSAFRDKLGRLLEEEKLSFEESPFDVPPLRLDDDMQALKPPLSVPQSPEPELSMSRQLSSIKRSTSSISQCLTEQAILHFVQAINNPPPVLSVESPGHKPYLENQEIRDCICIPGAARLLVQFDPRCQMANDLMTNLHFFRDENYEDMVLACNEHGPNRFPTFVIQQNRIWYKFTSSGDTNYWGFKFTIKPLDLRISDQRALAGENFMLGCFIFDLILDRGPSFVKTDYVVPLYNAIAWYVMKAKSSAKARGVELLIRLLRDMQRSLPQRLPNFSMLEPLKKQLENLSSRSRAEVQATMQSPVIQNIVELLSAVDLVKQRAVELKSCKEPSEEVRQLDETKSNTTVCLDTFGRYQVHVLQASYAVVHTPSLKCDVTAQLQQHVASYANMRLFLPRPSQWLAQLPFIFQKNDPSSQYSVNSKEIRITYRITHTQFNPQLQSVSTAVVREDEVVIKGDSNHKLNIKAEPSVFDRVLEMNSLLQHVERHGVLPPSLRLQSFRLSNLSTSFYQVLPSLSLRNALPGPKEQQQPKLVLAASVPSPEGFGASHGNSTFSLTFWMYLTDKNAPAEERTLLFKGKGSPGGSDFDVCPSISVTSDLKLSVVASGQRGSELHSLQSEVVLKSRQWTCVAVVCNGIHLSLFVDGTPCGRLTVTSGFRCNSQPFFFGRTPFNVGTPSRPSIDAELRDVRWFLRPVLAHHVSHYYSSTKPTKLSLQLSDLRPCPSQAHSSHRFATLKTLAERSHSLSGERRWTREEDYDVMELFKMAFEEGRKAQLSENSDESTSIHYKMLSIQPHALQLTEKLLENFESISKVPLEVLRERFLLLRLLNDKVEKVLPLVDFSQAGVEWSLAGRLSGLRSLVFFDIKNRAWNRILSDTSTNGRASVVINRPRARRAKERGDADTYLKKSLFGQMYRALHFVRPSSLRSSRRAWSVTYEGEGGQDAGGLFRDSISAACSDLQSAELCLLIPCPNARAQSGLSQEKWVPCPTAKTSLHLSMFAFLGKLMGVAIRGKHILNLDLPSAVWKPLVGQKLTREDLRMIDAPVMDMLEQVEGLQNAAEFEELMFTFSIVDASGTLVDLKERGEHTRVTWQSRAEYIKLVEEFRLNEFKHQVESVRRGLGTIVPLQLLPLFTWQELELMVCGKREIDIDFLRANTRYKQGVRKTDPHVAMFWETLKRFSHDNRQKFLRFVWGQSRLPLSQAEFKEKFDLLPAYHTTDQSLPVSHTCFFSLELPKYSSAEIMRKKLIYAINHCEAIDTDFNADTSAWDEE